jgi:hypothetical protein
VLVRQIAIGNTVLSIHQAGNGLELVAKRPTVGAADFCWRWAGEYRKCAGAADRARN